MNPSGSSEADQASGQSSQTKDSIGMEPIHCKAAAKIEIEDIPKPLNLTSPIEISEDSKSESGEPAQAEVNIGMEADYYKAAVNGEIGIEIEDFPKPLNLTSPIEISADSKSESGEPAQAEVNIGMEADYYKAAVNGEIGIEIEDIPKPLNLTSPIEISADSKSESGEPAQAEVNIGMEPDYYKAAANGKIKDIRDIQVPLDLLLTVNRNTVLHIYLKNLMESESKDKKSKIASMFFGEQDLEPEDSKSSTDFVEEILKECPLLLMQANVKDETPLHIAARYGHAAIVAVLIKHARERAPQVGPENGDDYAVQKMLEKTNNEKDTALHEAVRGNHLAVVKRLIEAGPDFSYSRNDADETPLYIAVERGFDDVALHILETCTSPAHDGPLGRTTLHAAAIVDNYAILGRIARPEQSALIRKVDKQRWTPLHCAAYFNRRYSAMVLLGVNRSIAYMKDAKGMTALHIAAHRGHFDVMESILEGCPDCCELVDERGWNALHFVVNSSSSVWAGNRAEWYLGSSLFFLLYRSSVGNLLLGSLLNEKDADGNTPLHHHSKSLHYMKHVMCHSRVDKMAFNKDNLNAYDVALTSELSDKKVERCVVAMLGAARIILALMAAVKLILALIAAVKPHPFKLCAFLCLAGYSLSQILIISFLHVAQFMQITQAFMGNGLRLELRRPLGDDILSERKDYLDESEGLIAWKSRKDRLKSRKDRFVSSMEKASKTHLVVDTLIATVAFTAGITMPGGFRDHDGPHPGSAVLTGNAAFKAFVITNTLAMVQSCSAAFIHLFMPLLFHDKNLIGDFSFLLASLAFCLSISAMGAMMLAFVTGTYAVLMHSLNLAIANSVLGLCFFIPLCFVCIGCSQHLNEMWTIGVSWVSEDLFTFVFVYVPIFLLGIFCFPLAICCFPPAICWLLCVSCYRALKDCFLRPRRSRRSRNDADQSTAS